MTRTEAAQILECDHFASAAAIKKAYLIAAKKVHPDKQISSDHTKFCSVHEAYTTLNKIPDACDFLDALFKVRNKCEVLMNLKECYTGTNKKVLVSVLRSCHHCRGSGLQTSTCEKCNENSPCLDCALNTNGYTCRKCEGKKTISIQKVQCVTIPAGTKNGESFGSFTIKETRYKNFTRMHDDLFLYHEVSLNDAKTGIDEEINLIDDTQFRLTCKPLRCGFHVVECCGKGFKNKNGKVGSLFINIMTVL